MVGDFNNYKSYGNENEIENYAEYYKGKNQKKYNIQAIKKLYAEKGYDYKKAVIIPKNIALNNAMNKRTGNAQIIISSKILPNPNPPEGLYLLGTMIHAKIQAKTEPCTANRQNINANRTSVTSHPI